MPTLTFDEWCEKYSPKGDTVQGMRDDQPWSDQAGMHYPDKPQVNQNLETGECDLVPAPSEEYLRGHRDGYAQRMAEERTSFPVVRNGEEMTITYEIAEPDPYRTAAVPSEGDDAASFRPTAPSLNGCWNRLDAQGALIQAERTENFNRYQSIQAELHQIQADLDRLDDRADEALLRQDRAVGEINERIAGDVHAINERLETIGSNHHAEYCDESTDAGHSSSHGLDSR